MKKILEHGERHYKGQCPCCGCLFEYDLADIYADSESNKELFYNEWCLSCPECGNIQKSSIVYNIIQTYEVNKE